MKAIKAEFSFGIVYYTVQGGFNFHYVDEIQSVNIQMK